MALVSAGGVCPAATYSFSAPAYNTFPANFTAPCPVGDCANFTPAMAPQGSFTTGVDFPPNLALTNATLALTGGFRSRTA